MHLFYSFPVCILYIYYYIYYYIYNSIYYIIYYSISTVYTIYRVFQEYGYKLHHNAEKSEIKTFSRT